ncbi:hypothetical protein A2U01_0052327, partial [Trifolium medium]|nr:hypothetical protein [Trifolium medium]
GLTMELMDELSWADDGANRPVELR